MNEKHDRQEKELKTYVASISAIQMFPGIIVVEQTEDRVLSCAVDIAINPLGEFFVGLAHVPQLLVQYEKVEAKEDALRKAHELFPLEDGWMNHDVLLVEIPRSMFIQLQLFTSLREIYHRVLRLAGFA